MAAKNKSVSGLSLDSIHTEMRDDMNDLGKAIIAGLASKPTDVDNASHPSTKQNATATSGSIGEFMAAAKRRRANK